MNRSESSAEANGDTAIGNRIAGGLMGLLLGDAAGVPYEFTR